MRILAAYLIFLGSYIVFALGKFPWMKIDRPGAAVIGAVLMVAFRIVGAQEALASIDFATIVLLFSMMLMVGHLRLTGFFDWFAFWMLRADAHHQNRRAAARLRRSRLGAARLLHWTLSSSLAARSARASPTR